MASHPSKFLFFGGGEGGLQVGGEGYSSFMVHFLSVAKANLKTSSSVDLGCVCFD